MSRYYVCALTALLFFITQINGQRITTIQLDGVQYFVSRMNPYSPELNYFLAYQYCRSLGLQLASFETKEKADSITQYLKNAGYDKYDFWTSGNRLGTDMFLWMSTGLPFNATFNYMKKNPTDEDNSTMNGDVPISGSTSPQRTARESSDSGSSNGCVVLKAPTFEWDTDDCVSIKDFICEQTRCYYYNYGSIPVSTAQGRSKLTSTSQYPSSSTTENIKNNFISINSIMNKLRSITQSSLLTQNSNNNMDHSSTYRPLKEIDPDQTTNGPYEYFNAQPEQQDDPSVINDNINEDYASTIQPDKITTIMGMIRP